MAKGITITELARVIGVTRSAVGQWEHDKTEPTRENVRAVAQALNIPAQELDSLSGDTATLIISISSVYRVPMLEWEELKHWPGEASEMLAGPNREYFQLSREIEEGAFALRINDNSLEPHLSEGDEVVIVRNRSPQKNDLVLARIAKTGQVLLRFYEPRRGAAYDLRPEHEAWETVTVNERNPAKILGVVASEIHYRIR